MAAKQPEAVPQDDRDGQQASKSTSVVESNAAGKKEEGAVSPRTSIVKERAKSEKIGHRRVKEGVITYKKTPTNMLMGAIQLGLEHAVGMITNKPKRDLLMVHFSENTVLDFPSLGSANTAAHHFGEFRFKAYAQIAFRHFREEFDIKADDFLVSLARDPMRELSNPGASGSVFYLSADDEFIIKTVQHKEAKFLQHLLPGYYMNLVQNKRTLLPKFFGLYCYQNNYGRNIRFVVMNNLLPSTITYHEKYDLKGSTFKRNASEKELSKKSPTLKDLDFLRLHPEGIGLEQDKYNAVMETLRRDTTVLESFKIMDYSLLLGVHNVDEELRRRQEQHVTMGSASVSTRPGTADERERHPSVDSCNVPMTPGASHKGRQTFSIVQEHGYASVVEETDGGALPYEIPPGGIIARNAKGDRLILYIGIIDILQNYRLRKKLEHSFKSVIHDGDTVSVHRPSFYADRFRAFFAKQVFHPYKPSVRRKTSSMRRQRSHTNPALGRPSSLPEEGTALTKKVSSMSAGQIEPNGSTVQIESLQAPLDLNIGSTPSSGIVLSSVPRLKEGGENVAGVENSSTGPTASEANEAAVNVGDRMSGHEGEPAKASEEKPEVAGDKDTEEQRSGTEVVAASVSKEEASAEVKASDKKQAKTVTAAESKEASAEVIASDKEQAETVTTAESNEASAEVKASDEKQAETVAEAESKGEDTSEADQTSKNVPEPGSSTMANNQPELV